SKYMTRVMHSRGDSEAKGERMAQPGSETANSGSASNSFAGDTACSSTRYDNGARRWGAGRMQCLPLRRRLPPAPEQQAEQQRQPHHCHDRGQRVLADSLTDALRLLPE